MSNKLPKFVNYDDLPDFWPARDTEADKLRFLAIVQANPDIHSSPEDIEVFESDLMDCELRQILADGTRQRLPERQTLAQRLRIIGKSAVDGFVESGGGASTRAW